MLVKQIKKGELDTFLGNLKKTYEIVAPVKEDIVRYKVVTNEEIVFERPVYPPKSFFFPNKEALLTLPKHAEVYHTKKRAYIMSRCDLNSILQLDKFLLREPADTYYQKKRQGAFFIEFFCAEPGEFCFCGSMDLKDFFDLRFIQKDDIYIIQAHSETAKKLVRNMKDHTEYVSLEKKFTKKLKTKKIEQLDTKFNSRKWKKYAKDCLMCCACTIMCPTCACFHITDEMDLDLKKGERVRHWSSCQNPNYSEVSGGHIFRNTVSGRAKHRVYCKLRYFDDNFSFMSCTGCGRCIKVCPVGMDFVKEINK